MRNNDRDAHSELLDSLQQRIQTEKSIFKRRLESHPAAAEEPAQEEGSPRPRKRRRALQPAEAEEPASEKEAPRPRRSGRLYQVFLALSVPEGES